MIVIIFQFFCGLIYLAGIPFGWDYKESSVYFCLWGVVGVLTISSFSSFLSLFMGMRSKPTIIKTILLLLSGFITYLSIAVTKGVIEHYNLLDNNIELIFNKCVKDFMDVAQMSGTTYEFSNLILLVCVPLAVILMNAILYKVGRSRL